MSKEDKLISKMMNIINANGEELEVNLLKFIIELMHSEASQKEDIVPKLLVIINSYLYCTQEEQYSHFPYSNGVKTTLLGELQ
jgi:hypothetical protein